MFLSDSDCINILFFDCWIGYKKVVIILDILIDLLNCFRKFCLECLLIVGDFNMGKMIIIYEFIK